MLETLLSPKDTAAKKQILTSEYGMVMTAELERRIQTMCNLSESLIEDAVEDAVEKERLDAIGMAWDSPAERAFEKGCKALEKYLVQNKGQRITKDYIMPDGYRLGSWVYRQKRKKKEGKLTGKQAEKLKILEHV